MSRRFSALGAATAALLLFLGACGGGEEDTSGSAGTRACVENPSNVVLEPSDSGYVRVIASSDLAVGENRLVIGLLDSDGQPATGAQLHVRIYCFTESGEQVNKIQADPTALSIVKTYTHTHDDGTVESHSAGELGVHVANVNFDMAGTWGLEATGSVDGTELEGQPITFSVREKPESPAIGAPAPRSVQQTLADVTDIRELDTSEEPIPEMHDKTIADAVTSGVPTVIAFATPAFCTSQLCGPAKEIFDGLYRAHGDQSNFVHVEPYFLAEARAGKALCPIPVMNVSYAASPQEGCPTVPADQLPPADQSWNLSTEPWVFVVDKEGNVAAKFEAAFSEQELEDALLAVLD
ncbi:MAG TPA: hypothetical protein VFO59_03470 [Dehalococcoidia bacterium]|nr:hypothetical protein [Dehalococcoidia bacterium]